MIFDSSLTDDQTTTLYIPSYKEAGTFIVYYFNDEKIPSWNTMKNPLSVKIPAGDLNTHQVNKISFHYKDNLTGSTFPSKISQYVEVNFLTIVGRNYGLFPFMLIEGLNIGEKGIFKVYENSQTRKVSENEQELFINFDSTSWTRIIILDKGSNDERLFYWPYPKKELRIIITKGEHTIDLILNPTHEGRVKIKTNGEQPINFNISSNPIRYLISQNVEKGVFTYKFTQQ